MTYEDVNRACAVLEQEGRTPSGNTVLAHLKARGLPASKRTVLKYLKLRQPVPSPALTTADDDPVYHVSPPSAPVPVGASPPVQQAMPSDPVAAAEAALMDARDALVHAKLYLMATRDLVMDGILHGSLHPHDPIHQQALADVDAAKREYDRCWAALAEARQQQAQQDAAQQQAAREAWVRVYRPEVAAELTRAEETYRKVQALPDDPQKPKAHYAARFVLQQARAAYQQALALAVPSTNGVHSEEG
jgi:hypothetical protein